MTALDSDPVLGLNKILVSPDSIEELPELLAHINSCKRQLNKQLNEDIKQYQSPSKIEENVQSLVDELAAVRQKSGATQEIISSMTSSMQNLDKCKRNLVHLMTVLKRLQMFVSANESLIAIMPKKDYKEILHSFGVVKDLVTFFKPYKSIDSINRLSLSVAQTQSKLVDDIFIDFEEYVTHKSPNPDLKYACEILEIIDKKYKDKLLTWFYNHQLKDIKSIFNNLDEAGSLDNLNRRYIYFNNILANTHDKFILHFPESWNVPFELSNLFCTLTRQDLDSLLSSSTPSGNLLEALTSTLNFENNLNKIFKTQNFERSILKVFEPYLYIWVNDQDKQLNSKFMEFYSVTQIPSEYVGAKTEEEFMQTLRMNSTPNISVSSIELFKSFHKILQSGTKISNGQVLVNLTKLFSKYISEFLYKILLPMVTTDEKILVGIEPLKYLTMILNTGDYMISNIGDLEEEIKSIVIDPLKNNITLGAIRDNFIDLINKSIQSLLLKIVNDLKFAWRHFANENWLHIESELVTSNYVKDYQLIIVKNVSIIFPLIIREGYVNNFCDRLIEIIIASFLDNFYLIKPMTNTKVRQLQVDIENLKKFSFTLPLYANPNYKSDSGEKSTSRNSRFYDKNVNQQFKKLETILDLFLVPNKPVEDLVLKYIELIGDRSEKNFRKVLNLKGINEDEVEPYLENFKVQISFQNTLQHESAIVSQLRESEKTQVTTKRTTNTTRSATILPEPEMKSPILLAPSLPNINNIEKNLRELALSGENQVTRFKNFSKFFRKDNNLTNE